MNVQTVGSSLFVLHGIPILLKDNITTKDRLDTTTGSLALEGSIIPGDADVVKKLRKVGAIILGKANLTEWSHFCSLNEPSRWKREESGSCFSGVLRLLFLMFFVDMISKTT
uniref:Amidase domain-containing protein n=1 Tax=Nelumbo nucifera TaxID=4432 RepID=A0A822Y901_NELNU|nr:TPA_asm: hypothetical protein HUJ06_030458 [Nelumbo nucifera]